MSYQASTFPGSPAAYPATAASVPPSQPPYASSPYAAGASSYPGGPTSSSYPGGPTSSHPYPAEQQQSQQHGVQPYNASQGYQPPNHPLPAQVGYQSPMQAQAHGQGQQPAVDGERGLGTMALGAMAGWGANKASGGHHGGATSAIGGAILAQAGKSLYKHLHKR